MRYPLLLLLGLLLFARPSLAQQWRQPTVGYVPPRALIDSLHRLHRYVLLARPAAVEQLSTYLLGRWPGSYSVYGYYPSRDRDEHSYADQHLLLYGYRAEARQQRGDLAGAEADLTQALAHAEQAYPYVNTGRSLYYGAAQVSFLREAYYRRALLRLARDSAAGACADLAASYQLDTVRAGSARWRGCPMPAVRVPLNAGQYGAAQQAYRDSLARVRRLLAARHLDRAERLLTQLAAGQAGPWRRVRPDVEGPDNLAYQFSQLARQRGDYARARTLLEELLAQPSPQPLHRYALGTLKIDYLGDREGGCQDLRWVYEHDTTRTPPTHPRWRGCALPRFRRPVSYEEIAAYQRAFQDSVARAVALSAAGQPARSVAALSRLIRRREAGNFAQPEADLAASPHFSRASYAQLLAPAYQARSQAWEQQQQYARAIADLDTIILRYPQTPTLTAAYCRRGQLRADFLHDPDGACADLYECFRRGGQPTGPAAWRGCPQPHWQRQSARQNTRYATPVVWQAGLLRQGQLTGVQAGRLFANDDKMAADLIYGPAVGLELAGNATEFVLAPRLSYEVVKVAVGMKLDATYYLNQDLRGDLRLTPQLGFCPLGALNIYYGYAIPVAGTRIEGVGGHRISVYINTLRLGKIGG